jgi:mono/diheme cytochrome c family protein
MNRHAMNFGLRRNYAVSTSDSGHWGSSATDGRGAESTSSEHALLKRQSCRGFHVDNSRRCQIIARVSIVALGVLTSASFARAAEAELIEEGRDLYADMCAMCHGRDMVNSGALSFDLRTFPKDDPGRFRNSVLNGKNQTMPGWRDKLSDDDTAALWAYVKSGG